MNSMVLIAASIAVVAAAFAIAPQREIRTEVMIDAAPEHVWEALTDTAAYPDWNPFIVSAKGEIAVGSVLENTLAPGKGKRMTFRPTVLAARESEELRWLGRFLLPRIFDGEHYFILEARAGGTRLIHGERFRGIGLWLVDVKRFLADFEAMNAALKQRAEALAATAAA